MKRFFYSILLFALVTLTYACMADSTSITTTTTTTSTNSSYTYDDFKETYQECVARANELLDSEELHQELNSAPKVMQLSETLGSTFVERQTFEDVYAQSVYNFTKVEVPIETFMYLKQYLEPIGVQLDTLTGITLGEAFSSELEGWPDEVVLLFDMNNEGDVLISLNVHDDYYDLWIPTIVQMGFRNDHFMLVQYDTGYIPSPMYDGITYNYVFYIEEEEFILINSMEWGFDYMRTSQIENSHFTIRYGQDDMFTFFNPETQLEIFVYLSNNAISRLYYRQYNDKGVVYEISDDGSNYEIHWNLLEADGWNRVLTEDMNRFPNNSFHVYQDDQIVAPDEYMRGYCTDYYTYVSIWKTIPVSSLTNSMLNLSDFGMSFRPELTLQTIANARLEAESFLAGSSSYHGISFYEDDTYDQLFQVVSEDVRRISDMRIYLNFIE